MTRLLPYTLVWFALGGVLMHPGSRAVAPQVRRTRWIKFTVYVALVHAIAWVGFRHRLPPVLAAIAALGAAELVLACVRARRWRLLAAAAPAYGLLAWGLLSFAAAVRYAPQPFLLVYLVVAVFDAFSQLTGQWVGRIRMTPRLSPGKTLEGLAGGLVAATLAAMVFASPLSLARVGLPRLALAGLAVAGLAFAGDLLASAVKRACGIKDFGAVLPGHGGILDRFDSLLLAAPVAYWAAWY